MLITARFRLVLCMPSPWLSANLAGDARQLFCHVDQGFLRRIAIVGVEAQRPVCSLHLSNDGRGCAVVLHLILKLFAQHADDVKPSLAAVYGVAGHVGVGWLWCVNRHEAPTGR